MNAPAFVAKASTNLNRTADFPILALRVRGRRLTYLDNGATTQKPLSVINAERDFYLQSNANIHRGVHWLSQHATDLYEAARERVKGLLNARQAKDPAWRTDLEEAFRTHAVRDKTSESSAAPVLYTVRTSHHARKKASVN